MKKFLSTFTCMALAMSWMLLSVGGASAGCHAFTVEASPSTVSEGGTVSVTVRRDNNFNPSNVDVSTVDESAKVNQDYTEFKKTVSFTNEKEQTFNAAISIRDDSSFEPPETFKLRLSNGGGCQINPSFSYGSATVTIQDNDPSPAPPPQVQSPKPTPATSPTQQQTTSPSPTASPSPSPESPSPEASPTESPSPLAKTKDDGGGAPVALIVAIAAFVLGGGAGVGLWLLRKTPA